MPQPPQNFSPGWFDAPHAAHGAASAAPHSAQKRRSARLSWLQDEQCMTSLLASVSTTPAAKVRKQVESGAPLDYGILGQAAEGAAITNQRRRSAAPLRPSAGHRLFVRRERG
jgi:hypothetical protein